MANSLIFESWSLAYMKGNMLNVKFSLPHKGTKAATGGL